MKTYRLPVKFKVERKFGLVTHQCKLYSLSSRCFHHRRISLSHARKQLTYSRTAVKTFNGNGGVIELQRSSKTPMIHKYCATQCKQGGTIEVVRVTILSLAHCNPILTVAISQKHSSLLLPAFRAGYS